MMVRPPVQVAYADSGGSGGNFKTSVPVSAGEDYIVDVEGQNLTDDRGLHLRHGLQSRYVDVQCFHGQQCFHGHRCKRILLFVMERLILLLLMMIRTVQIKKVNEGSADEDYFLLTPD